MLIRDNIPLPDKSIGGRPLKYPFDTMCIGQSFCLMGSNKKYQSIRSSANKYGKKHKKRFVTRMDKEGMITVWRDKLKTN